MSFDGREGSAGFVWQCRGQSAAICSGSGGQLAVAAFSAPELPVMARSRAGAHFHTAFVWLVRSFKLCGVRGESQGLVGRNTDVYKQIKGSID
jgi:hypothetical protein